MDEARKLREIADSLRKIAGFYNKEETSAPIELDPEKVRDFLVFFGVRP